MIAYNNITNFTKRPTADDEAVYTDYGSAGLKEYFSPPKESTVPTERTNSVVSSSAAIFGEKTFYVLIRNNISVFICIVQGFVMNKVQLDDIWWALGKGLRLVPYEPLVWESFI